MPLIAYTKPWQSHADLVALLQARGLIVPDPVAAAEFLAHVNYYRLSGYCLAFEVPGQRHSFAPDTTFDHLRAAYEFDFGLRDLTCEALEVVEVDLRTAVAHHFGQRYGAFGHTDPANFHQRQPARSRTNRPVVFAHYKWLSKLREMVADTDERFVQHFRSRYTESAPGRCDLPVWALTEVMSFGSLSRMVEGLTTADQQSIGSRYALSPPELASWVNHLCVVRNVSAHHGRLWDRLWTVKPVLPQGPAWRPPHLLNNQRLSVTLLALYHMLKRCPAVGGWPVAWRDRLHTHLAGLPQTPATPNFGFTPGWFAGPVWQ